MNKIIIPATFFCCLQSSAQQQWRFISFNVSNGLSQNSVHCIYQDRDGLLWLGTQDGLNSFDGRNFKTYKHSSSDSSTINDQFILTIMEDANGYLWTGTRSGINKFNKRTGKFTRYYLSEAEKNTVAHSFQKFSKNSKGEIFIYHDTHPCIINNQSEIIQVDTNLISLRTCGFDSQDRLWSFNKIGELFLSEKKNNYHPQKAGEAPAQLSKKPFIQGIVDQKDILWCYGHNITSKLYFYDIKAGKWLDSALDIPSLIAHINVTADGTGWVSTMQGIYIVKNYKVSELIAYNKNNVNGLSPGSILCSYEDQQGNIWIGSNNSGFAYYNPDFDNFRLQSTGTVNDAVTSVVKSDVNTKWIGAASGLYKINGKGATHFFVNKRITGLSKDRSGNIWTAIQNEGLYVLDQDGRILRSYIREDSILQTKNILYLFCDSKGRTFLCTEKGFFVFDPILKKWKSFYQLQQGRPSGWYVLHAFEDSKKNIWFSKHLGVEVVNENLQTLFHIESRETQSPISRTLITATTEDKNGVMWIATLSNGIYKYENKKLQQFTMGQGLSSNVIYGIICDDLGRLWAITTSGINIYVPEENRFYTLTSKDGLPADDFVLGALFKDNDGKILAGSSKGLMEINASNIVLQKQIAVARISEVRLNGESIETFGNSFVVKPGYKTLGFEFSTKQALQPRNIIYQYRMKGSEDNWNTLPPDNSKITYSNLPFRKLTMQVRAAYSLNDLEAAPIAEFSVIIKQAFWQTYAFRIFAAVLIVVAIVLLVQQYNKGRFRKQLQQLEVQKELQLERSRISRDLHDNIGAYTSALIAGINQLKVNENNNNQNIAELNDYASSIMGYMRETIWVLNNQHLTFTAFTDRFKNYANRIIKNYPNLSLHFDEQIENEKKLSPQVSLNLFRVMQEALQNACKHADASVVKISFSSNHHIQLRIADNGKGMNGKSRNDSYGLQNMKERAGEIGFDFSISSQSGNGTVVLITENSANAV